MSSRFLKAFNATDSKPLTLDGSLGTLLPEEAQNHPLWSTYTVIEDPQVISNIHKSYLDNGAQIVQTSTYQTSENKLKEFYPDVTYQDAIKKSIDISWEAIKQTTSTDQEKFIAGSVGPYGASLANGAEYTGDYPGIDSEGLKKFHQVRLDTLCEDERVDLIGFETIPNILEMEVCLQMMKGKDKPYYIALSVNGENLADGSSIDQIKKILDSNPDENLIAIGINCLGLSDSLRWLRKLATITEKKLIVYPNSGEKYDENRCWYVTNVNEMSWEEYLDILKGEFKGKLGIIGGCCRTNEQHTKLISETL
ncbi:hypothetical protein WICPIJ_007906 [Wickerhamomyces pijperi]|uniref:Hcy-binding domain-containing protein n=1 Tax=Wickerhamomyces pijperi TaxID=599730 RepID=A0A9P8PZC7_WICPI|nr:hypothetical protein WICPIJ_007906 [Wickerhamomyces pijperi]